MFVHLHVHSQYSILDALASVKDIAKAAKEMPAVALTDHGNLYGAVEFYKACKSEGVKPIIGCEFYVAPESLHEKKKVIGERAAYHLTLLAKNTAGYHNLCKLSSIGFLEGFYYYPRIDLDVLEKHSEGLVCLSGCMSSVISQNILNGKEKEALEKIHWFKRVFQEDFYLEIQRHGASENDLEDDGMYQESWLKQKYDDYIEKQQKLNQKLIALSQSEGIPLVATNDTHYIHRTDWKAHEVLLNIQSGEPCEIWEKDSLGNPKFRKPNPKRKTYPSHEVYFKTAEQMQELFKDLPEAISNTVAIADKCNVALDFDTKHYPIYEPPELEGKDFTAEEQKQAVEDYLWKLCEEGIPRRYTPEHLEKVKEKYPDRDPMDVVRERLKYEMSIIAPKGMCDYLLIVWDFINWAKNEGIPVGPGRGSGAGSIVLYLIGITDIEPLRFNLFFERFINPERISYPDIDVDICMDRRGDVINYTLNKYGKNNVAQIITFGTMKAKMVVRDVGRALSVPLTKVNAIAKLIPDDLNITLETALEKDHELNALYQSDEDAKKIIDNGQILEGCIRSTGIHAAGIIICGNPITEHIPVCVAKDSDMPVTQYSMKPVEQVGMLKMDFLGLKTLTCIKLCVDAIKKRFSKEIDWVNLHLDDGPTFDLLNKGATLGIFQLESGGMQDLARNLHLDRFEEIFAVSALYRPGPMDMIPSFINRKHGREEIENDHPWLKDILDETYGIMVYQEQVMQIASKLANYSLGEGDILRKAMGKKDHEQMAKEREKFREGAMSNGIDEEVATKIFDKMEKFAAYGFNKSHACAYGYVSYVTAFLKANYPAEWMAALMTTVKDDITKVAKFVREAQTMNIDILAPDINESGEAFVATPQGIRFAMSGIKGVGSGVVEAIVQERLQNGLYSSLYDFIKRIDHKKVGKKSIEQLVEAGAFDFTDWDRDALRESVEPMFESVSKEKKDEAAGMMSLFGQLEESEANPFATPPIPAVKTSEVQRQLKEKEMLGFFLTGHPLLAYKNVLQRLSCVPLHKFHDLDDGSIVRAAFILDAVGVRFSNKSQKKFAILTISDGAENFELPIWPELFEEKSPLLLENQLLYAVIQIDRRDGDLRLQCKWLDNLTQADDQMIVECDIAFDKAKQQLQRAQFAQKKAKEEKPVMKPEKQTLKVNADTCRLSEILAIKELFEKHRGNTPIDIEFLSKEGKVATLCIDENWGVEPSDKLDKALKKISSIV